MHKTDKKLICIVSQSHLCRNPRVLKEALTLVEAGYKVHILTAVYSAALLQEDYALIGNHPVTYSFYSQLQKSSLNMQLSRITRRLAVLIQQQLGWESKHSLGYAAIRLKKYCKKMSAELYLMHQELPTVIGIELLNEGFKVAFDIEDWYSEDLLPNARKQRPIHLLNNALQNALQKGKRCYTTSHAMALELYKRYGGQLPGVIYNVPYNDAEHPPRIQVNNRYLRLYWFSQTTGPGRGLEFFIECLSKSVFSFELFLRGNIDNDFRGKLNQLISAKDKLVILPLIANDDLLADMANYDIGLALEPDHPLNKDLTVSNKLFYYLAAGLPVIASGTKGHLEIAAKHQDTVFVYPQDDQERLVDILDGVGNLDKQQQAILQKKARTIYTEQYAWEKQSRKLLELINEAIEQN